MQCPKCGEKSRVVDTRYRQQIKKRRRICINDVCGEHFSTVEKIVTSDKDLPTVVKRDGRSEPFDKHKLYTGLRLALVKRSIDNEAIEDLEQTILEQILKIGISEVDSRSIREIVIHALQELDDIAYIRFATMGRSTDKDFSPIQSKVEQAIGVKGKDKLQESSKQIDLFGNNPNFPPREEIESNGG